MVGFGIDILNDLFEIVEDIGAIGDALAAEVGIEVACIVETDNLIPDIGCALGPQYALDLNDAVALLEVHTVMICTFHYDLPLPAPDNALPSAVPCDSDCNMVAGALFVDALAVGVSVVVAFAVAASVVAVSVAVFVVVGFVVVGFVDKDLVSYFAALVSGNSHNYCTLETDFAHNSSNDC